MREIIFRGKRFDGKWVEGGIFIQREDDVKAFAVYIATSSLDAICNLYEVDPETVGQYTGLKDKNGKRIFEGDIVTFVDMLDFEYKENPLKAKGAIKFQDGSYVVHGNITHYRLMDFEMSVIGNIHDNPELLEVR